MKAMVIFSGGLDSTVCLAKAINEYGKKNVLALTFDYGQKNVKELEAAKNITNKYNIKLVIMKIDEVFTHSNSSLLRYSDVDIPLESYEEQIKKLDKGEDVSTNVPFRNGLFLSIATSLAISEKIDNIYYGIHNEGEVARPLYPDCSEEFNEAMALAIYLGSGKRIRLIAPLADLEKEEIIKLGKELKVPFEMTWTCYENLERPCLKCTACMDRLKGFQINNLKDPLDWR